MFPKSLSSSYFSRMHFGMRPHARSHSGRTTSADRATRQPEGIWDRTVEFANDFIYPLLPAGVAVSPSPDGGVELPESDFGHLDKPLWNLKVSGETGRQEYLTLGIILHPHIHKLGKSTTLQDSLPACNKTHFNNNIFKSGGRRTSNFPVSENQWNKWEAATSLKWLTAHSFILICQSSGQSESRLTATRTLKVGWQAHLSFRGDVVERMRMRTRTQLLKVELVTTTFERFCHGFADVWNSSRFRRQAG